MTSEKEKILNNAYQAFMDLMMKDLPLDRMPEFISDEVMGYGTTIHEKLFGIDALADLIKTQRDQGQGLEMSWDIQPVHRWFGSREEQAVFVDEVKVRMKPEDQEIELNLRLSLVFEYMNGTWKIVHWHGSKPEYDEDGADTWHIGEWKQKNEELQSLVNEKTADLENKNRELEIETSLERVRSRTMGMQKSEELAELSLELVKQVQALGVATWFCAFNIYDEDPKGSLEWGSNGQGTFPRYRTPREGVFLRYYEVGQSGEIFLINEIDENECPEHYDYLCSLPGVGDQLLKMKDAGIPFPSSQIDHVAYFKYGYILFITFEAVPEAHGIFKRFAAVFEQSYTRFLDLQKAEAQARETQIELSLERIRAQVTAMNESSELLDVVVTMRTEFVSLGHEAHYFWHMRYLPEAYEKAMTSGDGTRIGMVMTLPRHIHGDIKLIADWEKGDEPTVIFPMDVDTAVDYIHKMITLGDFKQVDPNAPTLDDIRQLGGLTFIMARTEHGEIGISLPGHVPDIPREDIETLARFAGVFDLAYRRFEDLKESEHRNRETQIELALERVRSKTMAMHKSEELSETATILYQELQSIEKIPDRMGIVNYDEENKVFQNWVTDQTGMQVTNSHISSIDEPTTFNKIYRAWKKKNDSLIIELTGNELEEWLLYVKEKMKLHINESHIIDRRIHYIAFYSYGFLMCTFHEPATDNFINLLARFAKVFEQTYTRFLDLKQAEDQAREAQIEAALERVRAKTMAMHNSQDVGDTVVTLFEEVIKLGLDKSIRCGIGILEDTEHMETWSATSHPDGEVDLKMGLLNMTIHPMLVGLKKAWKSGKTNYSYDYIGEDVYRYYEALNREPEYPFNIDLDKLPENEYHRSFIYSEGILFSFAPNPISNEAARVLDRFARVFGQTYRRYRDLLTAELQAREAIKQSSLDRVRGKIASMRSPNDLDNITPLIWSELEILEVPFIRCGVFIIDESRSSVQAHLTTPDGKPIGALNLPFDANELTYNTVEFWKKNKVYTHHWNKEDFLNWMQSMIKLGQIQTTEQYQGYTKPPESLDLHFIPFKQGMLYVGYIEPLKPEEIELVETLAEAFSIAYARYEDFVHLEEAKTRVEKTLSELKSAQSQLIHSEKMASLGELTAGIAHEIQNPLNFVNNFSEVSVDLIDEMNEEMESGDTDEVKAISNDLKQNLEKITYHGQRASGIVKGMLEHSRAGNGHKELTDINELADEYLRLAYHGLRAKDKSFNADFKTDLDEALPKVNVVPQDIGRVLLNLINNAFFAVSAKVRATADKSFKPEVVITTSLIKPPLGGLGVEGDLGVMISVKDNGNGIPDNIKDKIFQPFFTTKPTGEGTGLGLSMSFDIITKGHGGELKVESKAGEGLPAGQAGTEFIIKIPIDK